MSMFMTPGIPKGAPIPARTKEMEEIYERYSYWHNEFYKQNGWMTGKILTLADASFSDAEQRKAFKDLVKQAFDEHFREHARSNLICLYNEACNILVGSELFPKVSNGQLSQ